MIHDVRESRALVAAFCLPVWLNGVAQQCGSTVRLNVDAKYDELACAYRKAVWHPKQIFSFRMRLQVA